MLPRGVAVSAAVLAATGGFTTLDGADVATVVAVVLASYVLGSVPAAVVVARRRQVDIRAVGDSNPGFWNTKESLGFRASLPVLVIDATKGIAAAALGTVMLHRLAGPLDAASLWWLPYLAGLAAMVGHAWPVFAGFRGGRCVLTFLGAWVVINPVELLVALAVCLLLWAVVLRFSLAARVGVFALPVVQAFADPRSHVAMTGVMMTLIGFRFWLAHRAGHPSHVR